MSLHLAALLSAGLINVFMMLLAIHENRPFWFTCNGFVLIFVITRCVEVQAGRP